MLERPQLHDEKIIACLQEKYGLFAVQLLFLPLGADLNTFVYRILAQDEKYYFLKLRSGDFNESSLKLTDILSGLGVRQIIPPLPTKRGSLWASLEAYKVILYPYIEGKNGFDVALSDRQWIAFGEALKSIHKATLPEAVSRHIPVERFSAQWPESLKSFLIRIENEVFDAPLAHELIAFLRLKRPVILDLIRQAEWFAMKLQGYSQQLVLCHSDIHAGNILIDPAGAFYIVDWDEPIWAPKERDLMFVGNGIGGVWNKPEDELLFYEGYGRTEIDSNALAYYRFERIIQDITVISEEISTTGDSGENLALHFGYLTSNFLPSRVIEIAYKSGKITREN